MIEQTYREGLYWPDECILFRCVFGSTLCGLQHKDSSLSTQVVREDKDTLNLGVSASAGTGIMISTLFAVERFLNWPLAFYKASHIDKTEWDTEFYLDQIFYSAVWMSFNLRFNPNQGLNLSVKPIWHQFKFSIRWNKWDGSIIFKSWQANTLVKFDIFKFHCFCPCSWK